VLLVQQLRAKQVRSADATMLRRPMHLLFSPAWLRLRGWPPTAEFRVGNGPRSYRVRALATRESAPTTELRPLRCHPTPAPVNVDVALARISVYDLTALRRIAHDD